MNWTVKSFHGGRARGTSVFEHSLFLLILLLIICKINSESSDLKPEEYTERELIALDQFRSLVSNELTQKWMHSDLFLIKWLRVRNLNVAEARLMLLKALEWRKGNGFDSNVKEDFGSWDKKFQFNLDTIDKYGHPVVIAKLGRWNPRQLILAGQGEKYSRFLIRTLFELPTIKAAELGVSQYVSVFDLHGFNGRQHICFSCLASYGDIVTAYEEFYPLAANKTIIINAPTVFETLMTSLRPLFQTNRKRDLQIYGYDTNQWKRVLLDFIDKESLPMQYGGQRLVTLFK